jgi:AcrR family transcriptional regulator
MLVTLGRTSVAEIAAEAGLSRATVYRHFPGGRPEIVAALVDSQIDEFFTDLADHVRHAPDFETLLVRGLMRAHTNMADHRLLQRVLDVEPELVLPEVQRRSRTLLVDIARFLQPYLVATALREDVDVDDSCTHLARLILSFIGNPGSWDLTDEAATTHLVRTQFLAGVVVGVQGEDDSFVR